MGLYKRNNTWYIDYYNEGKRVRQKVTGSRKLAEAVLSKIRVSKVENKYLDVRNNPDIDIARLAEAYLKYAKINKRTWTEDRRYVGNFVTYCTELKVVKLTTFIIEQYKEHLYGIVRQASINKQLSVLRRMFNMGILWGLCNFNPVKGIKFYSEERFKRTRYLSKEELINFIEKCPAKLKPVVVFALNTGMRLGEILNLEWKDINKDTQTIQVRETKNDTQRFVPINDDVHYILENQPKSSVKIFPVGRNFIQYNFERLRDSIGIPDFRFHDLRHTFASYLVMNGVDMRTVQDLMGHKSFAMTQRYSHLSQEHKKEAVNKLLTVTSWSHGSEKGSTERSGFDSKRQ